MINPFEKLNNQYFESDNALIGHYEIKNNRTGDVRKQDINIATILYEATGNIGDFTISLPQFENIEIKLNDEQKLLAIEAIKLLRSPTHCNIKTHFDCFVNNIKLYDCLIHKINGNIATISYRWHL